MPPQFINYSPIFDLYLVNQASSIHTSPGAFISPRIHPFLRVSHLPADRSPPPPPSSGETRKLPELISGQRF